MCSYLQEGDDSRRPRKLDVVPYLRRHLANGTQNLEPAVEIDPLTAVVVELNGARGFVGFIRRQSIFPHEEQSCRPFVDAHCLVRVVCIFQLEGGHHGTDDLVHGVGEEGIDQVSHFAAQQDTAGVR